MKTTILKILYKWQNFSMVIVCLQVSILAVPLSFESSQKHNNPLPGTLQYEEALNSITAEEFKEHISYLASDSMKGRSQSKTVKPTAPL